MEPIVDIENLTVSFSDRVALRDVTATVMPRQITAIIGPSGSGKTTFLRGINRLNELFPTCRTTGTVRARFHGRWVDVYREIGDVADLRRRAAMVFQSPHVLPVSIKKNVALPLRLTLGLGARTIRERVERALGEVELLEEVKDRLGDSALTLSGGQQQRLCLARALALEPEIFLLDEPTVSLDFRATQRIESLLLRLKERYPIVVVSHSLGQTSRLADRCYVLSDGRIVEEMDRTQLHTPELLQRLVEDLL